MSSEPLVSLKPCHSNQISTVPIHFKGNLFTNNTVAKTAQILRVESKVLSPLDIKFDKNVFTFNAADGCNEDKDISCSYPYGTSTLFPSMEAAGAVVWLQIPDVNGNSITGMYNTFFNPRSKAEIEVFQFSHMTLPKHTTIINLAYSFWGYHTDGEGIRQRIIDKTREASRPQVVFTPTLEQPPSVCVSGIKDYDLESNLDLLLNSSSTYTVSKP